MQEVSKEFNLEYKVDPISEDGKNRTTEITIINHTSYDFTPIAVFISSGEGETSIFVKANTDYNGLPKRITYNVSVPKDIFILDEYSQVQVYGFFLIKRTIF